ncbi:K(lysine) acetyltransferase [Coemansia biformis]|uniref:histone acetyltransferase n=1 Tax=Coemansia biformis TaxID=1286918 RepID=A0A9W8CVN3_9FUNG|nr:K(lysine) acetyltransferase [Coemansia biformis]
MGKQPAKRRPKAAGRDGAGAAHPAPIEAPTGDSHEIQRIVLGNYSIAAWYASPYPAEYKRGGGLYICQRCLKYMQHRQTLEEHLCRDPFPRGRLVYDDAASALYEVDGKEHTLYCQNLCLLSKLFLDQKTIYYDIGSFLFYILLTKQGWRPGAQAAPSPRHAGLGSVGYTFAGYFSKEKASVERNNLACILVLPPFRGQSYGQLLIELSYELTKLEGTTGGPEQPLSSQGFHSYRSYWRRAIVQALLGTLPSAERHLLRGRGMCSGRPDEDDCKRRIFSLSRLALLTGIRTEDVLFTLEDLGLLEFWCGRHTVCIADECIRRVIAERRINLGMRMDPEGLLVASSDMSDDSPSDSAEATDSGASASSDDDDSEGDSDGGGSTSTSTGE